MINIRRQVKTDLAEAEKRQASKLDRDRLDTKQMALKILANATSYGVFIEINPEDADEGGEDVRVYGADPPFGSVAAKIERPGRYFHPLLATLITGGARLMLAITETLALDEGLDWAFCDTDSMAFAKPIGMSEAVFAAKVYSICRWFETLNPYEGSGSILEMEKQNYTKDAVGAKVLTPLYCFAVSAKRYALFNERTSEIVIRKASAHGLGYLRAPYSPAPTGDDEEDRERESGVALWQEDVWRAIIRAAKAGRPRHVPMDWHPTLSAIAASQHTISKPDLLTGFRHYNQGKDYPVQVKPFNFMLWYHAQRREDRMHEASDRNAQPWNPRARQPKPASPFYLDVTEVPHDAIFDRETGDPVARSALRTYAAVLRGYHRSPETKFLNGGGHDIGPLKRRHIFADRIIYIGKEADAFEEGEAFGEVEDDITIHGAPSESREAMVTVIKATPVARLKAKAKVGHALIGRVATGDATVRLSLIIKLYREALEIEADRAAFKNEAATLHQWARAFAERHSVAELARRLGCDIANLAKAIRSGKLGTALIGRLRLLKTTLEGDNL